MLRTLARPLLDYYRFMQLPRVARGEHHRDMRGLPKADPRIDDAIDQGIAWLCRAQDQSASRDGGAARHYSLIDGWSSSYPETSGYIVPTLIHCAELRRDDSLRERARRMLDWLVSIQLPGGGFQGGPIGSEPVVPVIFNTGQILLGLAAGVIAFGDAYREPMRRAADWLVESQDQDGCWRKHPTPFAAPGEKAYETHVAWGLLEAERVESGRSYGDSAYANVRWALTCQRPNGFFERCCLDDPEHPLTHTLGYALRGVIEAHRLGGDPEFLAAARRTADGLVAAVGPEGFLAGRQGADFKAAVPWVCLTGSVQIAHCLFMLFEVTGDDRYAEVGYRLNAYVRRTLSSRGPEGTRGGVKGSFPVSGGYGTYAYLNWACKFFVDSNILEQKIRGRAAA